MTPTKPRYVRSHELVSRAASRLLIVDVQEKLVPMIANYQRMIANCRQLIQGAKILEVPVYSTEQYPKGLGHTVAPLAELLGSIPEKQLFSCAEVLNWGLAAEQADARDQ